MIIHLIGFGYAQTRYSMSTNVIAFQSHLVGDIALEASSTRDTNQPITVTTTISSASLNVDDVRAMEKRKIVVYSMAALGTLLFILILCVCVCIVILLNSRRNHQVESRSARNSSKPCESHIQMMKSLFNGSSRPVLFFTAVPRTPSTIIIHDVIDEEEGGFEKVDLGDDDGIENGAFYLKPPEYCEKVKPPSYDEEKPDDD